LKVVRKWDGSESNFSSAEASAERKRQWHLVDENNSNNIESQRVTNEVIVHTSSVQKKKPKKKAKKSAKKSFNYFYTSLQDIGNNVGKCINVYGVSTCNVCLIICCN
jgi:hypothetical protein